MDCDYLLVAENISKAFPGTKALEHVTLKVRPGEVHAVIGENGAGKSTLMNIIGGVIAADEGTVTVDGKRLRCTGIPNPEESGVSVVHQELAVCPQLSVMNNIFMGRLKTNRLGLVDEAAMNRQTDALLAPFQSDIKAMDITGSLTIAQQQVVEIAKAISYHCKILVLDEPTSSLTDEETVILFDLIRSLREKGIGILYISHRMNEIFTICDRATVLRDGQLIETVTVADVTQEQLISKMVGRNLENLYPPKSKGMGEVLLEAEHVSNGSTCRDVSFTLRRGEVLGFYGLIGSGRSEMARVLCGIDPGSVQSIRLENASVQFPTYGDAIEAGLVYVTEDRKNEGLFLNLSIAKNITASILRHVTTAGLMNQRKEAEISNECVRTLGVKTPTITQAVSTLSGGNQQKAMIGKWLAAKPKIIILDEPTRGIDVIAKAEIHSLLRDICNGGTGVAVISSELPEIIGLCDRVVVMNEGTVKGVVEGTEINEEKIMGLAAQH